MAGVNQGSTLSRIPSSKLSPQLQQLRGTVGEPLRERLAVVPEMRAATASRRVLRRIRGARGASSHTEGACKKRMHVITVCVCPTLDKGSSTTTLSTLHGQGGQACHIQPGPTKLGCGRGSTKGRFGVYLQQLLKKLSNPPCLIHGGYMFPPINLFPAAELVVASPVQIVFETTCKQCSTIHLRRLFHIAVLRHPSHRRN